jgi:outer membrane protease
MRDSDWDNEANLSQKSIYSESNCRLDPSYFLEVEGDLKVSDWLSLPSDLDLRPVIGYRWQKFNFVTHDGSQLALGEEPVPLPGNTLKFEQTYKQIFLGVRGNLDLGKWGWLGRLTTLLQIDWAYVEGSNQDQHLLRTGNRFTYEDTTGQAWHESIALKAYLAKQVALTLKADFIQIATTGTHRLVNAPLGIDFKFSNGVKVWSDQNSISLMLEYAFY